MGKLDGKICVVTGASGGLGKQTAIRFAEEGDTIICFRISAAHVRRRVSPSALSVLCWRWNGKISNRPRRKRIPIFLMWRLKGKTLSGLLKKDARRARSSNWPLRRRRGMRQLVASSFILHDEKNPTIFPCGFRQSLQRRQGVLGTKPEHGTTSAFFQHVRSRPMPCTPHSAYRNCACGKYGGETGYAAFDAVRAAS